MKQFLKWFLVGSLVVLAAGVLFLNRKSDSSQSVSESTAEESISHPEVDLMSESHETGNMSADNGSADSGDVVESAVSRLADTSGISQELPLGLRSIMDSGFTYRERLEQVNALDWDSLQPEAIEAIANWLLDTNESIEKPMEELAIRNDLLDGLIAQSQWADVSGRLLVSGVRDNNQHPLWREYALQYYSVFLQNYYGDTNVDPVLFDGLKATLLSSLSEETNGMAGTALLNIDRLQKDTPTFVEGLEWEAPATVLALNQDANMASRIPALQILPVLEPGISAKSLQSVIESPNEHTLVKLAAVNFARRACMAGHEEFLAVIMAARQQPSRVLSEASLFNH
ncbi:hypothetical protein [Cerasicoccus maritimus]|uniref:hypothetical protein n=1 Tax=Cerasicoccus maritimus TaxID=490089 RepID=UPI002852A516|nr:hypothetical protein [Cerasicoccus maritimus]